MIQRHSIQRDTLGMVALTCSYAYMYIHGILRKTITPMLSTWLLLSCATILSFVSNGIETQRNGVSSNMYNLVDGSYVVLTTLIIIFHRGIVKKTKRFDMYLLCICLVLTMLRLFVLLFPREQYFGTPFNHNQSAFVMHILVQCILIIAYTPLRKQLIQHPFHKDSITSRGLNAVAALIGAWQPWIQDNILSLVFSIRSALCTGSIVVLLLYNNYRRKKL